MKIMGTEDGIKLVWEYSLIPSKAKKGDTEYCSYLATLPAELVEYVAEDHIYIYKKDRKFFITTEEPCGYPNTRIKLIRKGEQKSKRLTIPKRLMGIQGTTNKKIRYTLLAGESILEVELI